MTKTRHFAVLASWRDDRRVSCFGFRYSNFGFCLAGGKWAESYFGATTLGRRNDTSLYTVSSMRTRRASDSSIVLLPRVWSEITNNAAILRSLWLLANLAR